MSIEIKDISKSLYDQLCKDLVNAKSVNEEKQIKSKLSSLYDRIQHIDKLGKDRPENKKTPKPLSYEKFQIMRYGVELDVFIGELYWRIYLSNKFWSNISTPLNLALTFLTALVAAKASTGSNFISEEVSLQLSFTSLIITTINSFFQPQKKEQKTNEYLTTIIKIGAKFEKAYWSNDDDTNRINEFMKIREEIIQYQCDVYTKESNIFTEFIWSITQKFLDWKGDKLTFLDGRDLKSYLKGGFILKKEDILDKSEVKQEVKQDVKIDVKENKIVNTVINESEIKNKEDEIIIKNPINNIV